MLGSPHPKRSLPGGAQLFAALPKALPTLMFSVPVPSSVDVGKSPDVPYVYIRHHGEVQNLKPIQVVTACSLDIYNFPFDIQNCSLTFTSWLHNSERWGLGDGTGAGGSVQGTRPPLGGPSGSGMPCPAACSSVPTSLAVRDINLSLWRQPELVKFDRSVFMNQGEWELLYVLSHFQEFSVKSSDSYAEMKFYVRALAFLGQRCALL